MKSVAVAVAQFAPIADVAANLEVIATLVAEASDRGARMVVFPEYSSYFVDPFDETLSAHAQDLDGSFVLELTSLAGAHDLTIVAGLVERGSDGQHVRNAVVAVDAGGVRAVYRKLHLYDAFGHRESDWVEPGTGIGASFDVDGFTVGLMTCYDLRFPEVGRLLVDVGTDLIVVPAEWVRGPLKEHHWRTMIHARAIENTAFVAAADHPPPLGVGLSMIVDPLGVEIAALGTTTGIAVAHLDVGMIERVRRVNPALALRRYRVTPIDG
ncbi:carbon-nitrogen hydrolase family protein [Microbacterium lacus]|uniref:carbon-nitrogen hydrolase family protein n=1 Tax=Microbacterium lacus TaxID=415217 RepID=UPI00384E4FA6